MEKQEIRTFGRRHGKKLSIRQQTLIDELLPTLKPTTGHILEIGFGAGEHVRDLARSNPDKIIIGAGLYGLYAAEFSSKKEVAGAA